MLSAFKARRPWATATIFILSGPFIGILFLNRGMLSLLYLLLGYLTITCLLQFLPPSFRSPTFFLSHGLLAAWLAALPLNVIGLIHGTMIARRRDAGERLHWYAHWYALVGVLLVFPALFFLVRTFLFQPFNLPTASMAPTLNKGDYFFARKFPYVRSNPQRGDMIVFNSYLGGRRVQYASRIVGLPGEHIRLIGGKLYINGSPPILKKLGGVQTYCDWGGCFSESEFMETVAGARPHRILQPTTDAPVDNTDAIAVPANSYFVLRDNRDISEDSWTSVRLVRANDIVGKVAIRYVDGRSQRWVWQTIE